MPLFFLRGTLGLDLGTTAIRAAVVEKRPRGLRLVAFTETPRTQPLDAILRKILSSPPFRRRNEIAIGWANPTEAFGTRRQLTEDPFIASMRCFVSPKDGKPRLFLEIGTDKSTIGLWASGLHGQTIIDEGGNAWTNAIAQTFNTPSAHAERLKRTCGLERQSDAGLVSAVLDDQLTSYAEKIQRSLDYLTYRFRAPQEIPLEIFGGGANLIGITSALSKKIGRPCITVRINPSLANVFASLPSTAYLTAPTAVGLALH